MGVGLLCLRQLKNKKGSVGGDYTAQISERGTPERAAGGERSGAPFPEYREGALDPLSAGSLSTGDFKDASGARLGDDASGLSPTSITRLVFLSAGRALGVMATGVEA
jgi:hypothetical protein